jgi:hypothetical protein
MPSNRWRRPPPSPLTGYTAAGTLFVPTGDRAAPGTAKRQGSVQTRDEVSAPGQTTTMIQRDRQMLVTKVQTQGDPRFSSAPGLVASTLPGDQGPIGKGPESLSPLRRSGELIIPSHAATDEDLGHRHLDLGQRTLKTGFNKINRLQNSSTWTLVWKQLLK